MDSPVGRGLCSVTTGNSWSMADSVAKKLSRKLPTGAAPVDARGLASFLRSVGDEQLRQHGIWWHSFSDKHIPIVLTNPAYARARRKELEERGVASTACSCSGAPGGKPASTEARYFGSHDYNAGRHAPTQSKHKATCAAWSPPTSGHLHSWRRGFDDRK